MFLIQADRKDYTNNVSQNASELHIEEKQVMGMQSFKMHDIEVGFWFKSYNATLIQVTLEVPQFPPL